MTDVVAEEIKAEIDGLKKMFAEFQRTADLRFQEWADDRKKLIDYEVRFKTIEAKIDGARDDIQASKEKVLRRVDEHLQPVPDLVDESVKEAIKEAGKAKKGKKSLVEKVLG